MLGKKMSVWPFVNGATGSLCKFVCAASICRSYAEHYCKCSSKSKKASALNSKYNSLLWNKREYNFSQ